MAEKTKMESRWKKIGSRWAFEMFIQVFYDDIVKGIREFLDGYTPQDIPRMVQNDEFPFIDRQSLDFIHGYEQYMEKISAERFGEAIAKARPDLVEALIELGEAGGIYIHKLRRHFLELIAHPDQSYKQGEQLQQVAAKRMKLATCDNCHQSWPVPVEDADKVTECPFCHAGRDEPSPPENLENEP